MPTLLLGFPAGRYHATPYGHHVNEGVVEWPPSPWRLLRALVACGYTTQHWTELPPVARRLFEALADTLPTYSLPAASIAHSRHYMPLTILEKGREKTTLVLDAWADVGAGTLAVRWACSVDPACLELFGVLAANLGYLGRSESWVCGEAIADDSPLPEGLMRSYPHAPGTRPGPGWEQVSLLTAEQPEIYADWRAREVSKALEGLPLPDGKKKPTAKLLKERAAVQAPFPVDTLDCLQRDTAWWKQHRWSQPPGSSRAIYWRSSDALSVGAPAPARSTNPAPVTTMLLALSTPSGNHSALPTVARTLPQAELVHRALVARAAKGGAIDCPELTGKDGDHRPLLGHQHAHVLPLDLDDDGHLDHVLIYAPMQLGPVAQRAVRELKRTWTKGYVGDLRIALAGQGGLNDLQSLPVPWRHGIDKLLGPEGGARVWTSATPFVLPRFAKRHGKNTLEGQVRAELASRSLPTARVDVLPWNDDTHKLRHVVRIRKHPAKPPPSDACYAIRLTFERPIQGRIITLGYGSHYGLGIFVATLS